MKTFTADEIAEMLGDVDTINKANEWLDQGEGIAVYQNAALDHSDVGHRRFFSFGNNHASFVVPPTQLPDFAGQINWRYQLEGTYRGKRLDPPAEHDWATPSVVLDTILSSFRSPIVGRPDRLVSYSMGVKQFAHGPSHMAIDLDVTGGYGQEPNRVNDALVGTCQITVTAWTNAKGEVDRLAPFSWFIEGAVTLSGGDPNLGSTIVATHNNSMIERP